MPLPDAEVSALLQEGRVHVGGRWAEIDEVARETQRKVLDAFHAARVGEHHFADSTGYALEDSGRAALELTYRHTFRAEAALVRPQIASGTHAIAAALFGILRPGDELLCITGRPYDTLQQVLGMAGDAPGSLTSWGVTCRAVDMDRDGRMRQGAILAEIRPGTRAVLIQRSKGYEWRPSVTMGQMQRAIEAIKRAHPRVVVFVDNCYGEFVETVEPVEIGADLIAGSLIKNPGGGLAPSGGYIVGKQAWVEQAAARVTAPGIGSEVGPTLGLVRSFMQGLFMAPHTVAQALKGAVLAAWLLDRLGYDVEPSWDAPRADIVQAIRLGSPEAVQAFASAIQWAGPVDHTAVPLDAPMPGYEDHVLMAGGTFVQGSSIELSCDAPMRAPYAVFLQGGLSSEHVELALERVVTNLARLSASRSEA